MSGKKKALVKVRADVSGTLQVGDNPTFIELTPELRLPADDPVVVANPDVFESED